MTKKYSAVDLIGLKKYIKSKEASFLERFRYRRYFSRQVELTLNLPNSYIDRGDVLCEDIERLSGEMVEIDYFLIMVIEDFLRKMSKLGSMAAYQYLLDKYSKVLRIVHYKGLEEEFELLQKPTEEFTSLEVILEHNVAYRIEIFLAELDQIVLHELTTEKVLEILFCHIIETVKLDGGTTFVRKYMQYLKQSLS